MILIIMRNEEPRIVLSSVIYETPFTTPPY